MARRSSPPPYAELHAASAFSFLDGASLPEDLVDRAAALELPAVALVDANGVYAAPRFFKAAREAGGAPGAPQRRLRAAAFLKGAAGGGNHAARRRRGGAGGRAEPLAGAR